MHDLRHTYATLRIMKGDNIVDVSKQLGHADVAITLKTYTHWMPATKKSQVDELDSRTAPGCTPAAPEYRETLKPELEENREEPLLVLVGDARLERAAFGSGDRSHRSSPSCLNFLPKLLISSRNRVNTTSTLFY